MDSCKKLLGKRIKELRKSKNLTQEKLAELVGFEPNHITKIEAGIHFPQPEKLDLIANVFDISLSELFNFEHKFPEEILKSRISEWLCRASSSEIEFVYKIINNLKEYKH